MNMTAPYILEAEAHGMPEPEPGLCACPSCERRVRRADLFECAGCGATICRRCLYTNETFMEHFCSEELTIYPDSRPRDSSRRTVLIPTDCYHQWCLDQVLLWQDKYFALKAAQAA